MDEDKKRFAFRQVSPVWFFILLLLFFLVFICWGLIIDATNL